MQKSQVQGTPAVQHSHVVTDVVRSTHLPRREGGRQTTSCQHQHHLERDVKAHHRSHEFSLWRGETPVPKGWSPTVVPGVRTVATQLLSADKVVDRLRAAVHPTAQEHFGAFYSSELGGIVTDPAMMFIHADDHMVHRGHGVFDTVLITDGHLYQLDEHVQRFVQSAQAAGISLPKSEAALKRIILDTAAASRKLNGICKFWLTAGRGGFGLSPRECIEPGFYAMVTSEVIPKMKALDRLKGYRACVSPIMPAGKPFATTKSNNYLRNTLALMYAEDNGYDVSIFVDEQGFVQEGPNMNLAIITQQDEFVTPPFEGCLAGVTVQRIMQLIPAETKRSPDDVVISKVEQRPLKLEDLLAAKEVFLTGSTIRVMPIVSIDDQNIADGMPGLTSLAFDAMLVEDQEVRTGSEDRHIPVPYGFTTGMKEQMT